MTRSSIWFVLAVLLAAGAFARTPQAGPQESTPAQRISKSKVSQLRKRITEIPIGTVVTVKLRKRKKLEGRLTEVSTDGFSLQTLEDGKITEKTIPLDQVKKISDERTSSQKKEAAWLIGGTALGSGILAVIILAATGAL